MASGGSSMGRCSLRGITAATGGKSTWHDWRWFGRLEEEDERLKKHYGRWMNIVR